LNNLIKLILPFIFLFFYSCATNNVAENMVEEKNTTLKEEKLMKGVYIAKLKNGATAIIKERKDTQGVSVQVWFGVGSVFEKDNERGLSHFLEHMLFNGTKYTKPGEIEAEIEKKGGYINAATSYDYTFYYIEIAHPFWKDALKYLYYMTTAPNLTEEMIEKEKPIVLEELNRRLDNPKSKLWDRYHELAYLKTNYRYPVIGFRETIEKFNEPLVKNYFYSHYVPSNTYIVVVGNIDKDKVLEEIEKTWGSVEGKYYKPPKVPLEEKQTDIRMDILKHKDITRGYIAIGWQLPPQRKDKDTFTAHVLETILFGGRTSVLYQRLKETGLVQGIFGGYLGRRGTSQFMVYFITDPNKIPKVKEEIFKIVKEYREKGVPEELVENAKKKIINSEVFARESATNEAESLGYAVSVVGDITFDLDYTDEISKITKKDVDDFVKRYITTDSYTEVQLLPKKGE